MARLSRGAVVGTAPGDYPFVAGSGCNRINAAVALIARRPGGLTLALMPHLPGIPIKIALTTIGLALPSVIYVISNAVIGEITPVAQRGALLAIGTAVSTSAGLLASERPEVAVGTA